MLTDKKILIVDDEVLIAEHLKSTVASYGYNNIEMAHNYNDAIKKIETYLPNLVLLDIRLEQDKEGIEIAKIIQQKHKIPFIFITAFSDKILINEALKTHPHSFITKPFKAADIFAAINLIFINQPTTHQAFISFKYGNEFLKLSTSEIQLIERDGNYITLHCSSKKYLLRHSLEWVIEKLPTDIFLRIHRSFLININFISTHNKDFVVVNNVQIPISRNMKKILLDKISSS